MKKVLKSSKIPTKTKCIYCEKKIAHMITFLDEEGDIHVHAPFDNKYMMNAFSEAIIREQNKYDEKDIEK